MVFNIGKALTKRIATAAVTSGVIGAIAVPFQKLLFTMNNFIEFNELQFEGGRFSGTRSNLLKNLQIYLQIYLLAHLYDEGWSIAEGFLTVETIDMWAYVADSIGLTTLR